MNLTHSATERVNRSCRIVTSRLDFDDIGALKSQQLVGPVNLVPDDVFSRSDPGEIGDSAPRNLEVLQSSGAPLSCL